MSPIHRRTLGRARCLLVALSFAVASSGAVRPACAAVDLCAELSMPMLAQEFGEQFRRVPEPATPVDTVGSCRYAARTLSFHILWHRQRDGEAAALNWNAWLHGLLQPLADGWAEIPALGGGAAFKDRRSSQSLHSYLGSYSYEFSLESTDRQALASGRQQMVNVVRSFYASRR